MTPRQPEHRRHKPRVGRRHQLIHLRRHRPIPAQLRRQPQRQLRRKLARQIEIHLIEQPPRLRHMPLRQLGPRLKPQHPPVPRVFLGQLTQQLFRLRKPARIAQRSRQPQPSLTRFAKLLCGQPERRHPLPHIRHAARAAHRLRPRVFEVERRHRKLPVIRLHRLHLTAAIERQQVGPKVQAHPRPRRPGLRRNHLPQHAEQLLSHLVRRRKPVVRLLRRRLQQEPVERLLPGKPRLFFRPRQRIPVLLPKATNLRQQHRQRPPNRIQVRRPRRPRPGLRRAVAHRPVDVPTAVVHPAHPAHVDQLHIVLLEHHVVRLEVAEHQPQPMQIPERRQNPVNIRDRLGHRQRPALLPDLLQRLAAHVLHHDEAFAPRLHKVVNPHNVRVLHRRQELPLRHRHRCRRLILRIQEPLQHHVPRQHRVEPKIDPPQPAKRNWSLHQILPRHHVPGLKPRHKAVLHPAFAAEPRLPPQRSLAPRTKPLPLRHHRLQQHRPLRVGRRQVRQRHQPRAQLLPARPRSRRTCPPRPGTRAAHRRRPRPRSHPGRSHPR